MMMWFEIIVVQLKSKLDNLMIWFDNCGCHKTYHVDQLIAVLGIQVACLPPNIQPNRELANF